MAFGMRQWLATLLVGFALVAAWRLPPEPVDVRDESVRSAERIRFQRLENEVRLTTGILFRQFWADSLSARVVAEAVDGVAVLVPPGGDGVEGQRLRFQERLRRQARARSTGDMVFGYVIQPHDHRKEDGAYSARSRTETYVGTRDGVDYCLQVRVDDAERIHDVLSRRLVGTDTWSAPYEHDLGPCGLYLTYGFPGGGIERWLEGGALEFAFEPPLDFGLTDLGDYEGIRRGVFGYGFLARGDVAQVLDRCLAGVESACGRFLRDPTASSLVTPQQVEIVRRSPATGIGSAFSRRSWVQGLRHVLADLEADFGADAFQAFWTSPESFDAAFEGAFGITPGAWMVQRIEKMHGVEKPGPGVPRHARSASMLTIAAFLGIAYWRRRERQTLD